MKEDLLSMTSKEYQNHYEEFEDDQEELMELARDWEFNVDFVD